MRIAISTARRTLTCVVIVGLAVFLTAACAGEENGDDEGLTDGLGTPTTTLPTTAPEITTPSPTVEVTVAPTLGTDASPTAANGGAATSVTVEDVQAHIEGSMPDVSPEDITGADFVDGELTVDTAWDSSMATDAESLCEELLMMTVDPPVDSVIVNGTDGSSLAECGAASE